MEWHPFGMDSHTHTQLFTLGLTRVGTGRCWHKPPGFERCLGGWHTSYVNVPAQGESSRMHTAIRNCCSANSLQIYIISQHQTVCLHSNKQRRVCRACVAMQHAIKLLHESSVPARGKFTAQDGAVGHHRLLNGISQKIEINLWLFICMFNAKKKRWEV